MVKPSVINAMNLTAKEMFQQCLHDFGYENIGLPTNLDFLNPLNRGNAPTDFGLGGVLINSQNSNWKTLASQNIGIIQNSNIEKCCKRRSQ